LYKNCQPVAGNKSTVKKSDKLHELRFWSKFFICFLHRKMYLLLNCHEKNQRESHRKT
jgi:hypothetical protein